MGKRFIISEDEKKKIRDLYLIEEPEKKDDSKFFHGGNVKKL